MFAFQARFENSWCKPPDEIIGLSGAKRRRREGGRVRLRKVARRCAYERCREGPPRERELTMRKFMIGVNSLVRPNAAWRPRKMKWRRGRDSNPGYQHIPVQRISNPPLSTAQPPLRRSMLSVVKFATQTNRIHLEVNSESKLSLRIVSCCLLTVSREIAPSASC